MDIQTYLDDILKEINLTASQISNEQSTRLLEAILDAGRVFVAGAGRSGLAVKGFAMRLMHLGFEAYVVGETVTPAITHDDLLLIGSGSGTTSSLVTMAKKAQEIGANIALITILDTSPIAQLADIVLTIPAPTPKLPEDPGFQSIQPMGSLFEQCLALTLNALILMLMARSNIDPDSMFQRHANLE